MEEHGDGVCFDVEGVAEGAGKLEREGVGAKQPGVFAVSRVSCDKPKSVQDLHTVNFKCGIFLCL